MPKIMRPLVITPGEPAGVGTEIVIKAWQDLRKQSHLSFALLGDAEHVTSTSRLAGLQAPVRVVESLEQAAAVFSTSLPILHRPLNAPVLLGAFTADTAKWVTDCIEEAVTLCLSHAASAMVTCPIQKEALYAAGFAYQGHTDFLAALCHACGHAATEVMMLAGGGLRAGLETGGGNTGDGARAGARVRGRWIA